MVIVTSSFSKRSVFKMLTVHTKMYSKRFFTFLQFKDVRANCFCASLLRTRIICHAMPRHASSARAKY